MQGLSKYLEGKLAFRTAGNSLFGEYNGFNFVIDTAKEESDSISVSVHCKIAELKGRLHDFLESKKQDNSIHSFAVRDFDIEIIYNSAKHLTCPLDVLISDFSELLRSLGAVSICTDCGNESIVYPSRLNGSVKYLCVNCINRIERAISQEKNMPNNYFPGILGSLVGALLGSVIWILIGLLNFYASIAGFAIAYASFHGYKVMKGKNTKIGVLINIAAILVAILFAEYIGVFIELTRQFPDLSFSRFLSATPILLKDNEFMVSVLPNLGLGLLFAALGCFRLIRGSLASARAKADIDFIRL